MDKDFIDDIGDNHVMTSATTPMRDDAFDLTEEEKIERIQSSVRDIMETLL